MTTPADSDTATVRYGARRPAAQVDHEVKATKAPIVTEAITVTYLTLPHIVEAVLPPPLTPADEPVVRISLQRVEIPGRPVFGSAVFSVAARHGDLEGDYPLFMPQSTEQSVVGGRETFGEPKKLAAIEVHRDSAQVAASVERMGHRLITVAGEVTGDLPVPPPVANVEFYFKFLRSPDGSTITDPHLVYGTYERTYEALEAISATVELGESPLDPVADIVIADLRSVTWCQRRTRQTARIAGPVAAADLLPYVHQRYDDIGPLGPPPAAARS